jgi:hypothetical protein
MPETKFFTCNGAADLLERDRRTVRRAMAQVPPDGHDDQGRPVWTVATVVRAMARHAGGSGDTNAAHAALDDIERLAGELEEGIERLRLEPDVARRRELLKEVGPSVGALDRAMIAANSTSPPAERALLDDYCLKVIMRPALGHILGLCELGLEETQSRK